MEQTLSHLRELLHLGQNLYLLCLFFFPLRFSNCDPQAVRPLISDSPGINHRECVCACACVSQSLHKPESMPKKGHLRRAKFLPMSASPAHTQYELLPAQSRDSVCEAQKSLPSICLVTFSWGKMSCQWAS